MVKRVSAKTGLMPANPNPKIVTAKANVRRDVFCIFMKGE
jgi:hypothetical protein